jgi:hypothetical protein
VGNTCKVLLGTMASALLQIVVFIMTFLLLQWFQLFVCDANRLLCFSISTLRKWSSSNHLVAQSFWDNVIVFFFIIINFINLVRL